MCVVGNGKKLSTIEGSFVKRTIKPFRRRRNQCSTHLVDPQHRYKAFHEYLLLPSGIGIANRIQMIYIVLYMRFYSNWEKQKI